MSTWVWKRGTISCNRCFHLLEVNCLSGVPAFLFQCRCSDVLLWPWEWQNSKIFQLTPCYKFTLHTHSGFHPRWTHIEILFWYFTQTFFVWWVIWGFVTVDFGGFYSWIIVWMLIQTIHVFQCYFNTLVTSFPFSLPQRMDISVFTSIKCS